MSVAKCIDEDRARFGFHWPHRRGLFALPLDDLAASMGRRQHPGNDQDAILIVSHSPLGKLDLDCSPGYNDALDGGA